MSEGAIREDIAYSVNGVPIRLTDERWEHIVIQHSELESYRDDCVNVIEHPDLVLRGYGGALIAVKGYGRRGYLTVVYKEVSANDGFVITAHFSRRIERRGIIWRP